MTQPVAGLAVRPSHLPTTSHWCRTLPPLVNSTIVLSRFPSLLAWPCGPTPFWNPVNRLPPRIVMSSGWVSGSDFLPCLPAGVYQWCRLAPDRIWCTVYAGVAGVALAGAANAARPDSTAPAAPIAVSVLAVRPVTMRPATLNPSNTCIVFGPSCAMLLVLARVSGLLLTIALRAGEQEKLTCGPNFRLGARDPKIYTNRALPGTAGGLVSDSVVIKDLLDPPGLRRPDPPVDLQRLAERFPGLSGLARQQLAAADAVQR